MKKNTDLFIKRFEIEGLFGIYNVKIPFSNNINIFVGENGFGKTTILNCLNFVLQCDVDNLYNIDFKSIFLEFGSGDTIRIKHEELITDEMLDIDYKRRHLMMYDDAKMDDFSLVSLIKKEYRMMPKIVKNNIFEIAVNLTRRFRVHYGLDVSRLHVEKILNEIVSRDSNDWELIVQNNVKDNIIYLPTYRRIEEDFNKCMYDDVKTKNTIMKKISNMQFGMRDVELLIKNTCDELKNSTNEGFKEMTSNLLKNYVSFLNYDKKVKLNLSSRDNERLSIVFSRLADEIGEELQQNILDFLFDRSNFDKFEYKYLVSIINSLLEIYEKNKFVDEGLDRFVEVCNNYLEKNILIYDKFKVECSVLQKNRNEKIAFRNLSSGEKQIVSLFSKIYLSKTDSNLVLFDEPELSLSITWQSKLLPDIIESERCKFLMVITHSPFIFNNDLKHNTRYISDYIEVVETEDNSYEEK